MKKVFFILTLGLSLSAMSCSNNPEQATVPEVNQEGVTIISKDVDVAEFSELISKEDGQVLDRKSVV